MLLLAAAGVVLLFSAIMDLSIGFHIWCKSRRVVEVYLDILILNHSPLFPIFQRIFMSVNSQHFTADIRQDIEIL